MPSDLRFISLGCALDCVGLCFACWAAVLLDQVLCYRVLAMIFSVLYVYCTCAKRMYSCLFNFWLCLWWSGSSSSPVFFGMAIFQEKWETDMFFTQFSQFSKFTHWHPVQVHSVHKVASWYEGGHTDNRHSTVNMGLLALKEGRQIIFPFSTNFLHWWSRTVRVYHPPCVFTTLQASARDEILASGGSLSHHHGGTYITIYFSHAFQLHHMQIFWEFVQK